MPQRAPSACLALALLCVPSVDVAAGVPTSPTLSADIPAQSLAAALSAFGETTGLSVFWPPEMDTRQSPGAHSGLTPERALSELLHCTGLTFEFQNARTVRIYPESQPESACTVEPPPPSDAPPIPEVTIQGTRWERRVKEMPIDIEVWHPNEIDASGVKGIADIGALTPGVSFDFFSSVGSGIFTNIIIRGITDRHGSATGIFFDDIPLPAARSNTFGRALPPSFDLASIGLLRGPQGVLLGADTQGGAVRFVPNQPSLTTYSGFAHVEWAATVRGNPSYEAGAATGGPLVPELLGFRFSAWQRSDGGYVNLVNPFTAAVVDSNANRLTTQSVRGVLTYAPTASLEISPSISYVSSKAPDSPSFFTYLSNPDKGELNNGSLLPQPFNDTYYIGSVRLTDDIGLGELDSRTSYYHRSGDLVVDDTESVKWGGWGNPLGDAYPVSYDNAVTTYTALRQNVFSQELRLTSPEADHPTSWTAGLSYYTTRDTETYHVVAQSIPLFHGSPLDKYNSTTATETRFAGFGLVSYRVARRWTLGAGLRVEHEQYDASQAVPETPITPITPPVPTVPGPRASAGETVVAPKFSITYESDRQDQYYLLAARGYAPAGVDAALPTCFEDMSPYPTDTLWSYELGAQVAFLDGRARLDGAVFEAHWNNGQALTTNCLVTHIPGSAVSKGFDLKTQSPLGKFLANLEVSYIDARYTETISDNGRVIVNDGDALGTPPLVASPWNLLASLERTLTLRDSTSATIRIEDAFHSRNSGPFYTGIPQPSNFKPNFYAPELHSDPAINLVNVRATVNFRGPSPMPDLCHCAVHEQQGLEVSIFLNNALDSQPVLLKRNKGADLSNLYYATTFRPRTLGLAGTWRF